MPSTEHVPNAPEPAIPPPPQTVDSRDSFNARPGDLTTPWRIVLAASWVAAFFAYAAVWQASVQIGIGTWWIGPRAIPTPAYYRLLPFALTLALAMFVLYNTPRIVRISFAGTALAALIAIPDFSRSTGLALAELLIAGLLLLITVSALTGRYQLQPAKAPDWLPPTPDSPSPDAA